MLAEHILPIGAKIRRSFSFAPGEKSLANRIYRAGVDRCLARRHRLTDYFFALSQHMSRARLEQVVNLARVANVELMTHPQREDEFELLMGDEFRRAISGIRLAGFEAL
jgi:hypothetical protein